MFNITQYGNVVNIDSEDVIFHITGSYASGTSFMVANIWAEGYDWDVTYSGTFVANVKLIAPTGNIGYIRNSYQHYNYPQLVNSIVDTGVSRDASGISTDTFALIHHNESSLDDVYPGPMLSDGNYIYFYDHPSDVYPYELRILEYDILSGTGTSILVCTNEDYEWLGTGEQDQIALIGNRKVLVHSYYDFEFGAENPNYHVYIVDFEANTCTETLTFPEYEDDYNLEFYPYWIGTIKQINTNIIQMMIVGQFSDSSGVDVTHGVFVWHSYGSGWNRYIDYCEYESPDSPISLGSIGVAISNNRYLCIFGSGKPDGLPSYRRITGWAFDTVLNTLEYATAGDWSVPPYPSFYQVVEDVESHNVYVTIGDYDTWTYNTYKFIPSPISFSIDGAVGFLMESKENAFAWDSGDDFYRVPDSTYFWSYTRPLYPYGSSQLMDDDGTVWFISGTHFMAINISGDIIKDIDVGVTPTGIIHLGSTILLYVYTANSIDYYLVT
jgi:hypothetical protein